MEINEKKVLDLLNELDISYKKIVHAPVYTCDEMKEYLRDAQGVLAKNLFLRNKSGNRHFLVVMDENKIFDIKAFGKLIGVSNLSFGSAERLMKYLGVSPGSVSIFGIINDIESAVEVYIEKDLINADFVNFHPNVNTATYNLSRDDFQKFLDWTNNKVEIF